MVRENRVDLLLGFHDGCQGTGSHSVHHHPILVLPGLQDVRVALHLVLRSLFIVPTGGSLVLFVRLVVGVSISFNGLPCSLANLILLVLHVHLLLHELVVRLLVGTLVVHQVRRY